MSIEKIIYRVNKKEKYYTMYKDGDIIPRIGEQMNFEKDSKILYKVEKISHIMEQKATIADINYERSHVPCDLVIDLLEVKRRKQ